MFYNGLPIDYQRITKNKAIQRNTKGPKNTKGLKDSRTKGLKDQRTQGPKNAKAENRKEKEALNPKSRLKSKKKKIGFFFLWPDLKKSGLKKRSILPFWANWIPKKLAKKWTFCQKR